MIIDLIIEPPNEYQNYNYFLLEGIDENCYEISIVSNLETDFLSLISNPFDLDESIGLLISMSNNSEKIKVFNQIKNNKIELLKNARSIYFNFRLNEVIDYISHNPFLRTKKIIIHGDINTSLDDIKRIKNNFDCNNLLFSIQGNKNYINIDDFENTVFIINNIVNYINRFNFSPLEKIMYTYDLVRDHVYQEVDDNDDKNKSRDLTSVLLGNKRVCVGYSVLFMTILENLGIKCNEIFLVSANGKYGHVRNEIYIQDKKYNVDGVYYFDSTWDSKRKRNNDFLSSYKYFAMTKEYMDKLDDGKQINKSFAYFSPNLVNEVKDIIINKGIKNIPKDILHSINHMFNVVFDKPLIDGIYLIPEIDLVNDDIIKEILTNLEIIYHYYDHNILANTLLKVLFNVRKIEYYSNPFKYKFSLDEFLNIVLLSNWKFDCDLNDYFKMLLNDNYNKKSIVKKQLDEFNQCNDIDKKIEQVKFTKVLRLYYNQKSKQGGK